MSAVGFETDRAASRHISITTHAAAKCRLWAIRALSTLVSGTSSFFVGEEVAVAIESAMPVESTRANF